MRRQAHAYTASVDVFHKLNSVNNFEQYFRMRILQNKRLENVSMNVLRFFSCLIYYLHRIQEARKISFSRLNVTNKKSIYV